MILSKDGKEIKKSRFNHEGTYMVFFTNEIHSPDASVEITIKELKLLKKMNILEADNRLSDEMITNISRYKTFEFMRDLI